MDVAVAETAFEDDEGVGYWVSAAARQISEVARRLRRQLLAGIMSVVRAVSRFRPRLIVGSQQGGMVALLCSLPLVLELALRERVATATELQEAFCTWPAVEGFIGIEPFIQGPYND